MKTIRILCLALLTCCLQAMADNKPTLTINGTTVSGQLTRIMFEGDNALLEFSDADLMEVDMASVMVSFEYEADPIPTGVKNEELRMKNEELRTEGRRLWGKPMKNEEFRGAIYDLQGRRVMKMDRSENDSSFPQKGIYIQNGKKIIVK